MLNNDLSDIFARANLYVLDAFGAENRVDMKMKVDEFEQMFYSLHRPVVASRNDLTDGGEWQFSMLDDASYKYISRSNDIFMLIANAVPFAALTLTFLQSGSRGGQRLHIMCQNAIAALTMNTYGFGILPDIGDQKPTSLGTNGYYRLDSLGPAGGYQWIGQLVRP